MVRASRFPSASCLHSECDVVSERVVNNLQRRARSSCFPKGFDRWRGHDQNGDRPITGTVHRSPCAHRISNLQGDSLKGIITGHLTVLSLSLQYCLLAGRFRQCRPPFFSRYGSGHLLSGNLRWSLSKHLRLRVIENHKQDIRQCPK